MRPVSWCSEVALRRPGSDDQAATQPVLKRCAGRWTGREMRGRRRSLHIIFCLALAKALAGDAAPIGRQLQQASPAAAPSGSLVASAKQADYSRTVCQFQVLGAPSGGLVASA